MQTAPDRFGRGLFTAEKYRKDIVIRSNKFFQRFTNCKRLFLFFCFVTLNYFLKLSSSALYTAFDRRGVIRA